MRLNEINFDDSLPVDGYGPGFFRVGGAVRSGAMIVSPSGVLEWNGLDDAAPLLELADNVDVLFVGTGEQTTHLPNIFRCKLEAAGIGVEAMNSPSACRTYNVLLSEGRRVALAVLPV